MLLIGAAFAALAAMAGTVLGVERLRRRRYVEAAHSRGWTYSPRDPVLARRWEGPPFGQGRLRRARHVLRGEFAGRSVVAFEYSFRHRVPGGPQGPAEAVSTWGVLAMALPAPLPRVAVTRSGPIGRFVARMGRQDLQLESADFNRRFRVRTDDPRVAYDVLNPRTMIALLDGPFFDFRLESSDALSCWPGRLTLEHVDQRLPFLARVVDGVPDYVWRDRSR